MRRQLGIGRVKQIAAGFSAVHDVETVPLAEEVLMYREIVRLEKELVKKRVARKRKRR
jgi:hypothetical protein